ncbi:hypothetical protein B0H13DRAFT_2389680 [Mycena leptocephala]|nr:hypothetical protein B0H13DRAFT_2389680 [Mycena leptocephala]
MLRSHKNSRFSRLCALFRVSTLRYTVTPPSARDSATQFPPRDTRLLTFPPRDTCRSHFRCTLTVSRTPMPLAFPLCARRFPYARSHFRCALAVPAHPLAVRTRTPARRFLVSHTPLAVRTPTRSPFPARPLAVPHTLTPAHRLPHNHAVSCAPACCLALPPPPRASLRLALPSASRSLRLRSLPPRAPLCLALPSASPHLRLASPRRRSRARRRMR